MVFSYTPQHDDELPLCVGQTINVLQEVEEGWWKGVLDGQVGMFPSNFVEEMGESEESNTKQPESSLENINNQLNVNGRGSPATDIKPNPVQGQNYGVKVSDLKREEGLKGEPVIAPTTTANTTTTTTNNGSAKILGLGGSSAFQPIHRNKESLPKENGQLKNFRDLPHKLPPALEPKGGEKVTSKTDKTRINALERATVACHEEKPKVEQTARTDRPSTIHNCNTTNPPHHLPPPQLPPKPVRELARVMFPYTAEHEDELELREGDIITVLCKELEDKGWWKGELGGNVGVFPDNFVELLSSEEVAKPPRPEKPATVLAKKGSPSSSTDSTPTSTLNKSGKEPLPSPVEKEPPPPLPEKKVSAPPPPEKKPTSQSSPAEPHEGVPQPLHTPPHPAMSKHTRKTLVRDDGGSLTLDTDGEKLTHVTQLRPKGPSHRRPPSGLFKENMKNQYNDESQSPLPPTSEDKVDHDMPSQANGELSRSPSVPALNQPTPGRPVEMRTRPETSPRPESNTTVPWLQELGLKQKHKRLSGTIIQEGESSPSAPAVSPKPAAKPTKPTIDNSSSNVHVANTATTTQKAKPTETPRLPTPDYEHKPFTPQPPPSKNKPLPSTPQPSESKRIAPPSQETKKLAPIPPSKDSKKPPPSDNTAQVEEKIDALYKELLPKMRSLEERVEEQRKEQNRKMQALMKELDEERKKRACMEVEVERLRKLVDAYAQV